MLGGRQDSNRSGSGYNSTSAYDADSSDDGDDDFSYGRLSSVTHNSNNNLSSNNGRSQLLSDLYDTIERPLQPTRLSASAVSPHHHRSPHHRQELSDHMESFPMSIPHDSSVIVTPQRNHNNNTVFDDGRYGAVSSDSSDSRAPRQVGKLVQHFEGIKPVSHPSPSRPLSTMQTTIASTTRATWASVNNRYNPTTHLQL